MRFVIPAFSIAFLIGITFSLPPWYILLTAAATMIASVYTLFDNGIRGLAEKEPTLWWFTIRGQRARMLGFFYVIFGVVLIATAFLASIGLTLFLITSN